MLGIGAGIGEDEPVLGQGGDIEADGQAALLGALQVSGAAHLHVFLGQFKAVFRSAEKVQPLLALLGYLGALHEDAVGAFRTPAHAAAQLVQLAQAEALGTLNHHHRGVGHVHPHLYHGGGHQDIGPSGGEGVHVEGLVGRILLPVYDGHLVLGQREGLHNLLIAQLEVLVVHLFALKDERIHNKGLPALGNLVPDEVVHGVTLVLPHAEGCDGLAARGHLVYHGHVQVSVQGHGQGARDGGGRHHQHVRRGTAPAFVPEAGTLLHAKAVLLVHDGQAQGPELHRVFNERMGSYQDADAAVLQSSVNLPAPGRGGGAGEEGTLDAGGLEVLGHIGVVLLGKHFGGGHDAGLVAVPDGDEGTQHGHHGFSGAHVTLQQAVHLVAAAHVFADFLDHALLGGGELVRKGVVAVVEGLAHLAHDKAHGIAAADVFLLEEGQLKEEKFLEFEPISGFGQRRLVLREVNLTEGVSQGHQALLLENVVRKGFPDGGQDFLQGGAHQAEHHLAGDAGIFEFLGRRIHARKHAGGSGIGGVHLRVHHVQAVPEHRGLPEEDEGGAGHQACMHPLHALEKDHLHLAAFIGHHGAEAAHHVVLELPGRKFRAVFGKEADFLHRGPYLHLGQVRVDVGNTHDAASVYVAEGIQVHQVLQRTDSQLGFQELRPLGAHSRKVLYGGILGHLQGGDDVTQKAVEIYHMSRLGGIAQNDHHQFLGGNNVDLLAVVPVAGEHVFGDVGQPVVAVKPEEGAIAPLAGRCRRTGVIHPSFREDALSAQAPVVQVKLTEASIIPGRHVEVGRAYGSAAHVGFKIGVGYAEGLEKTLPHIGKEFRIGGEFPAQVTHHDVGGAAGIVPEGTGLVLKGFGQGIQAHVFRLVEHDVHVGAVAVVLVPLQAALHLQEVVQGNGAAPVGLPFGDAEGGVDVYQGIPCHYAGEGAGEALTHAPAQELGFRAYAFAVTLGHDAALVQYHKGERSAAIGLFIYESLGDGLQLCRSCRVSLRQELREVGIGL